MIVAVNPGLHGLGSLLGRGVRSPIGPFAQGCLDEALGLAIGARRIGLGADVLASGSEQMGLEEAAAIGRAIVGHDPLDLDAVGLEEGEGAGEKGASALLLLVGQNLGVG